MEMGEKVVIETETKEDRVALQFAQLLEVGGLSMETGGKRNLSQSLSLSLNL